jgi:RNA polymerase sigma factor (sigma-70 family)
MMTTAARPALGNAPDDAELARAAAAGDRRAFAAIYDRYSTRLFDFCVGMLRDRDGAADCVQDTFVTAASRLAQLREPDRLGSWLYAIARNEALARIRARRREQPSEYLPETASGDAGPDTLAARSELADLISEACGGLSDRDRAVYELAYRQGLDGRELADALGVSHTNANTLVGRLRDNVERALGALLVCRGAATNPDRCPELAALVEHWDGRFTVLIRKRVARHIEGCATCDEDRRRRVNPVALLGSVPLLLPAPAALRGHTLTLVAHTVPLPPLPPGPPVAPAGGGHVGGGVGSAHGSGGSASWWPPRVFDTSDLGAPPPAPHPGAAPQPGASAGPPAPRQRGGPFAPPTRRAPAPPAASTPAPQQPYLLRDVVAPPAPVDPLPIDPQSGRFGGHVTALLVGVLVVLLLLVAGGGIVLAQRLDYQVAPASSPGASTPAGATAPVTTTPAGPSVAAQTVPVPAATPSGHPTTTFAAPPAPVTATRSLPVVVPSVDTTPPVLAPRAPVFTTPSLPTTTSSQGLVPQVVTSPDTVATTPSSAGPSAAATTATFPFRHWSGASAQDPAPSPPSVASTYCPGTHYGGPCPHP